MISFEKFFDLINNRGYSQNELIRDKLINARLLNSLRNNKSITTDSLNNICNNLNCTPFDIMSYKPDHKLNKSEREEEIKD